jgi:hypothetical protein
MELRTTLAFTNCGAHMQREGQDNMMGCSGREIIYCKRYDKLLRPYILCSKGDESGSTGGARRRTSQICRFSGR